MLRESLVHLLLAEEPATEALCPHDPSTEHWVRWVNLAESWGALPRLAERLSPLGTQPPEKVSSRIQQQLTAGYVRTILEARSGLAVLQEFAKRDLRAAAFKGLATLAILYPDPKQRVILDADLLIAEEDLPRAADALAELGYRPEVEGDLAEYVQFVRHSPGFGGNEELSFHNDRGNTIDLHWRLGAGFDSRELLEGSRPVTFLDQEFSAVSARDGLLLCVHHSLRNHFTPDKMMRDLLDLERWCAEIRRQGDPPGVLQKAMETHLAVPLLAAASILRGYSANGEAARIAAELEPKLSREDRAEAARLVALFHTQVREGPMERDLLYLFRPTEFRQILSGIWAGGRRHMELSRSMDAALAGEQISAWHRIATIGRSLLRLRPRHIGMLRALARSKDAFGTRS